MAGLSEGSQQDSASSSPKGLIDIPNDIPARNETAGLSPFSGHEGGIYALAYSPDSRFIVTGSKDTTVRLWDVKTGKQVGETMKSHEASVQAICYSPDGRYVASGGDGGKLCIWDTEDGNTLVSKPMGTSNETIWTVAYSPDGRFVASGGNDHILRVWDTRLHDLAFELECAIPSIWTAAWAPDGKQIAAGSADGKVCIFDVKKREPSVEFKVGQSDKVYTISWSPNGDVLATGCFNDAVWLWIPKTGKAKKSPFRGHKSHVYCIAWSPDGTRLISGALDHTVRVWDTDKGQTLFKGPLLGHKNSIQGLAYSSDGKQFASGDVEESPRVQIWDAETGKPLLPPVSEELKRTFQEAEAEAYPNPESDPGTPSKMNAAAAITAVAWLPSGKHFVSSSVDGLTRIWGAQKGYHTRETAGQKESVNALAVSADNTKLATASDDHIIRIFDPISLEQLTDFRTDHTDSMLAVHLTPDASRLVTASKDKTVRFWDVGSGKLQHVIKAHTDSVRTLAVAPDGKKLASGADDNTILIWDMQTYDQIAGPFRHDGCVRALCFSPDGARLLSGSDDCTARIWDVFTDKDAFDIIRVHAGAVGAVDWSSDGKTLLTAGADDWTVWVWNATTGEPIHGPLEGDGIKGIQAAAFSPDSQYILAGSSSGTLCIWETNTGKVVLDRQEKEKESTSDIVSHHSNEARNNRTGARRQSLDDSIMNMPATVAKKTKDNRQGRGFWDEQEDEGGQSHKAKTVPKERRRKRNVLKGLWMRRADKSKSRAKGKRKENDGATTATEGHEMRRTRWRTTKDVVSAREKLRVLAAGDKPRAPRGSQEEPESDGRSDSPTDPADPNESHADSSSDDESVHGLVDTLCFCLCLPCCK